MPDWIKVIILSLSFTFFAQGNEHLSLNMWDLNYQQPHIRAYIGLALRKSGYGSSDITITPHSKNTVKEAFTSLSMVDGGLDLIIAGVDKEREQTYLPLYIPLERGLLGFRVCLISKNSQQAFKKINSVSDFSQQNLTIGLVRGWPDVDIMNNNGIPVAQSLAYSEVISALKTNQIGCFSRSVIEAQREAKLEEGVVVEERIAMIYPFADIIYVNPNNPKLWQILNDGFIKAVEDEDFFRIFSRYYGEFLEKNRIYERKLLIMDNPHISAEALQAINEIGVVSFNWPANKTALQ